MDHTLDYLCLTRTGQFSLEHLGVDVAQMRKSNPEGKSAYILHDNFP